MDVYLHATDREGWKHAGSVLRGLRLAAETSCEAILLTESPVEELADIVAAAWFFQQAGGRPGKLSVASPYPAASWIAPVRTAAVDRVFVVPQRATSREPCLSGLIEVPRELCPALGVQVLRDGTLSVCGQSPYQRVLSTQNFASRCFSDWSKCERRDRV